MPSDIVDILLHAKYPGDWELDTLTAYEQKRAETRIAEIRAEKGRLEAMRYKRPAELDALYGEYIADREGYRARQLELDEPRHLFHQPGSKPDFTYWVKFDRWTIDQSIALLMGRSPDVVKSRDVLEFFDRQSPFAMEYAHWLLLAKQSEAMNHGKPTPPADVLVWALAVGIAVPPGLLEAFDEWTAKKLPLPAPAVPVVADTNEPMEAPASGPDRGSRVKRKKLIVDNARRWPTIEQDLKDGSTNGLSKAARDTTRGFWHEGSALAWARDRGKLQEPSGGRIHRIEG